MVRVRWCSLVRSRFTVLRNFEILKGLYHALGRECWPAFVFGTLFAPFPGRLKCIVLSNYGLMCAKILSQDDEELQWLAVAKQGKGVEKSEKRQESAETEYHRLLCEESIQQVRGNARKRKRLCGRKPVVTVHVDATLTEAYCHRSCKEDGGLTSTG